MNPAPSIIAFTTLSGLGFGLLFWLGVDNSAPTGWVGFAFFAIAYALAVGGLLTSAWHLGRKERAIKAFRQWKTSWLSREAWMSVSALVVGGIYAAILIFLHTQIAVLGWISACFSLAAVFTTSMIYEQIKSVPRWNMPATPILFLSLSVAGGALLSGRVNIAIVLLLIAALVQIAWWRLGDRRFSDSGTDMETATGLGEIGKVRAFEPPHTGTNFLLHEMIYVVGRKHAQKLRVIALVLGFALPIGLLLIPLPHIFGALAVLSHLVGVATSRWLFFAEAEHVVGLYYGKR